MTKTLKNILSKIMIMTVIITIVVSFPAQSKAVTNDQQNKIANFAKAFIEKGNEKGILVYDQTKRTEGYNNNYSTDGKMHMDCSSFAAFVYNHTCNLGLSAYVTSDFLKDTDNFSVVAESNLYSIKNGAYNIQLGDLVLVQDKNTEHIGIYVGNEKIAHFANSETGAVVASLKTGFYSAENEQTAKVYILRLNKIVDYVAGFEEYVWPNGEENSTWVDENLGNDFAYNGISIGTFGVRTFGLGWIVNSLAEILDWFIGILTYVVRIVFVGLASYAERLPQYLLTPVVDEVVTISIDSILFNKVAILDINIFNLEKAGGSDLSPGSIIYIIRSSVAQWYYIIRNIAIVGLLITLLYIGIRMAISSIAEEKAKYKQLLINWVVSFIIVFGMHYFMIAIITINEQLLELIANIPVRRNEFI